MRNAECGMRNFLILSDFMHHSQQFGKKTEGMCKFRIPHSAFRIPYSSHMAQLRIHKRFEVVPVDKISLAIWVQRQK